jgi:F0F1-type ATP synthase epsilon subunit
MLAESIIPISEIDLAEANKEKAEAMAVIESKEPGVDKEAAKHKLLAAKAKIKAVTPV